jgi:hypothetical protein
MDHEIRAKGSLMNVILTSSEVKSAVHAATNDGFGC